MEVFVAVVVAVVVGLSVAVMLLSTQFLIKFPLDGAYLISIIICVPGTKHNIACGKGAAPFVSSGIGFVQLAFV